MEQRARAIVAMQIQRAVLHHKFVAWAAIAICALLILGVMAYRLSTSEPHPKKSNSDTLNSDSKPDSDTLKYQKNTEMIDKKSVESLAPALPSKAEAGPTKLKEDAAKTSAKQVRELAQRKRNAKAAKRRAEARDRIAKANQSSTRFVPAPSQNRFVQPRQPAQKTSSGAREGSIVTLSGRFDPNALQRCGLKCTLRFKDQSGKSYSLVFFKAQYQSILSQKRGRAVVSGRLGAPAAVTVLYLQSVR
jgi:type IV secretory pathway VirB10-like protein